MGNTTYKSVRNWIIGGIKQQEDVIYILAVKPMNWLVRNLSSFVSRRGYWDSLAEIEHGSDLLVSDYVDPVGEEGSREIPATSLQRKQAAVLYADIANYARLTEEDEEGTHHRLVKAIRTMMSHVADNKGRNTLSGSNGQCKIPW